MSPFIKYLPHLSVTALIVFLAADYFSANHRPLISSQDPGKTQIKNEGSHDEGSHKEESQMEGSHNNKEIASLSPKERERRMGIFHYNEGNKFYKEGNFAEAIIRYQRALKHNSDFKEALINLSTAYMKNEMLYNALETLQEGQKQFPEAGLIDYNLACYYSLTKNVKPSLSALQSAIDKGYKQFTQMESDPDLENLRQSVEYQTWKKALPSPAQT
jgi:tetratricopeptide (TPR) repeat protein